MAGTLGMLLPEPGCTPASPPGAAAADTSLALAEEVGRGKRSPQAAQGARSSCSSHGQNNDSINQDPPPSSLRRKGSHPLLVGIHKPNAKVVLLQQVQVVAEKVEQVLALGISLQDKAAHWKSGRRKVVEQRDGACWVGEGSARALQRGTKDGANPPNLPGVPPVLCSAQKPSPIPPKGSWEQDLVPRVQSPADGRLRLPRAGQETAASSQTHGRSDSNSAGTAEQGKLLDPGRSTQREHVESVSGAEPSGPKRSRNATKHPGNLGSVKKTMTKVRVWLASPSSPSRSPAGLCGLCLPGPWFQALWRGGSFAAAPSQLACWPWPPHRFHSLLALRQPFPALAPS